MLDIDVRKTLGTFTIHISFVLGQTGITALFGPSGAGKSSLINMVAGLISPDSGRIVVDGQTVFHSEKNVNVPPEKRRFGYVFQDGRLFPHLSVQSNLTYGMKLVPEPERYVSFDQVVDLLDIGNILHRRPANLSGGEKQRVAIGRALLTSPRLLLMDEPLASLDQARKAEIMPFIRDLHQELAIPILYVSHLIGEVLHLSDTLVVIDSGRVNAVGKTRETLADLDLLQLSGYLQLGQLLREVS